jgi:hypothetical protein
MISQKRKLMKVMTLSLLALILISITGCLYPNDQTPGYQVSAREAVLTVQDAVDRFNEQTGLLPIQNSAEDVPVYEKYKVDFGKLKRMGFIAQVPTAAFENGGTYQFLIIDEETKPQVKLLDLTVFQAVADVQKKVDEYRLEHSRQNPAGIEIYPGFAVVDFNKLGTRAPDIISVYSRQSLNLLVNVQGQVRVDYGIDLATAIKKSDIQPQKDEDLRRILIEASYFVPVRSPVYRLVDGEPQAVQS